MLRVWKVTIILLILAALTCSCQGNGSNTPELDAPAEVVQLAEPPARSVALAELVADIRDAESPEGIEAGLYEQLKEQLIRTLEARGVSKIVSTPPMGEQNQVTDLQLYGNETDGFELRWTYVNVGDLNKDGLVAIADLTPIGQYFNESWDGSNWAAAHRADANGDGLVTINDITPVGQYWLTYCTGYNVYGSANDDGPWSFIGDAPLPTAPGLTPFEISYEVPGGGYWYYQIRPHDDEGNEGEPSQVSRPTIEPPKVELGVDLFLKAEVIDPTGGEVETDLGVLGQHLKFIFPPGAVMEPLPFEIGTNDGSFIPSMGELKSPIVALKMGGEKSFGEPIRMEAKFDRTDYGKAVVPFIVDDAGELHLVDLVAVDQKTFTAVFETYHLYDHLIWVIMGPDISDILGQIRSINFQPALDGLQVVNTGSMWHPGGECFGMTSFSNWYFNAGKTWSEGNLFPRFMYNVPIYGGRSGQRIICTRAHTSIGKEWPNYWHTFVSPQGGLNDAQRFASVVNGIVNAGHPVLVDLRHESGAGGAHSVLAYAFDTEGFFVYDPNAPGVERYIHFDSGTGSFDSYSGYDSIRYSGSGALWVDEPYQSILTDAKHQFAANGFATIAITSHGVGQDVPTGSVLVTGHIESTVEIVDEITVNVNGVMNTIAVPSDGNFSTTVNIVAGRNDFWFATYATRLDDTEVFIPHDMPGGSFYIDGV